MHNIIWSERNYFVTLPTVSEYVMAKKRFNAFKNKVAQDIQGFIEKAQYEGWRDVIPGKHPEKCLETGL